MTKKTRLVPLKNYFLAAAMLIGVIFLFIYAFSWKTVKEEEKLLESYLINSNTISLEIETLEELETFLIEQPDEFFIFTGYTGSEEEYLLEKDLKPIIDDYNLSSIFYYLDITDLMDDDDLINKLSDILGKEIKHIPTIIYVKQGVVAIQIDKDNNEYLEADDFIKLLEVYEFEKSN